MITGDEREQTFLGFVATEEDKSTKQSLRWNMESFEEGGRGSTKWKGLQRYLDRLVTADLLL